MKAINDLDVSFDTNEKYCGIYIIYNTVNDKVYIGQSIDIKRRISSHINNARNKVYKNVHLYNAINKYGIDNFMIGILELCDREKLSKLESKYINKYNSADRKYGYNIKYYDDTNRECMSDETKLKISKTLSGKTKSKEHIANMPTKFKKGHKLSIISLEKRNNSIRLAHINNPNAWKGHIAWNKGKHLSVKHIEKLRQAKLGKKQSKEHIEARSKGRENKLYMFSLNGVFINKFDGVRHFCKKFTQFKEPGVRGAANGSKIQYLGYIFRYARDIDVNNPTIDDNTLSAVKKIRIKSVKVRGSYRKTSNILTFKNNFNNKI